MNQDTPTIARKYRISELIFSLHKTTGEKESDIRKRIRKACNNAYPETLSEWENLEVGNKRMIPADRLMSISKILGCTMEDLFTPVKNENIL